MANESELEKMLEPGSVVTVSFPALIKSASTASRAGYGPMPSSPFSLCSSIFMPAGMKLLASVGMPMPRLTYMPSANSRAARRAMRSRTRAPSSLLPPSGAAPPPAAAPLCFKSIVSFSMRFS